MHSVALSCVGGIAVTIPGAFERVCVQVKRGRAPVALMVSITKRKVLVVKAKDIPGYEAGCLIKSTVSVQKHACPSCKRINSAHMYTHNVVFNQSNRVWPAIQMRVVELFFPLNVSRSPTHTWVSHTMERFFNCSVIKF